tara:strand:- start:7517 stop:7768 length:252 start_codon:yes stop_codon:yes gene_type:complete
MKTVEQEAFKRIKSVLGEHFDNFAFVILDEDGEIFYSFKNQIVGKALFAEASREIEEEAEFQTSYLWEDDEDSDNDEWLDTEN